MPDNVIEIEPPELPMPTFELPKIIAQMLKDNSIGTKVILSADYEIVGKSEDSARIEIKNLALDKKRRV